MSNYPNQPPVPPQEPQQFGRTTGPSAMPPQEPGSLVVIVGGQPRQFQRGETVLIGRSPDCQILLDDNRMSRHHAQIAYEEDGWVLRDLGSRNGTFIGPTRVVRLNIAEPCAVRFGNPTNGQLVVLQPGTSASGPVAQVPMAEAPQMREPSSTHQVANQIKLGRAPDNDIVLGDLLASRYHTEVRRTQGGFEVIDLASRNGTYLNGQRVSQAPFAPGDLLSIGHHQFVLRDQQLVEYVDEGRVSLRAEDLTVTVGNNVTILDRVGFTLDECSLVAVVGPSGAGKSTMLNAMTGTKPATSGRVIYEGRDLYDNYEDLRHRIGLVPQDDILHRQLTVKKALEYAAALRFPDDVSKQERQQRIAETCASLGLTEHIEKRITQLSGGQRKRVSVALELLTQPSLLYLDEPTSGLDPGLDKQVMTELRRLADDGRTVIVVTHSVLNLDMCDRVLLLAPGGKTAYFGPPGQPLLNQFRADDYSTVFQMVTNEPDRWQEAYRQSPYYRQYGGAPETHNDFQRMATSTAPTKARRQQNIFKQFWILCRRMVSVTVADKAYAGFVFGSPILLALLTHTVPANDWGLQVPDDFRERSAEPQQLLLMLVLGACLIGTAVAIRELVGEIAIYKRERLVGLSPGAYLASKLFIFGIINIFQAHILVLAGLAGRKLPDDPLIFPFGWMELVFAIAVLTITSTTLGLLVSSRVTSNQQTMPILVVIVMGQLVFTGGLFKIIERGGLEQASWLFPARWGYSAVAATADLRNAMRMEFEDPLWEHEPETWLLVISIMVLQAVVLTIATRLMLITHEPSRSKGSKKPPIPPGYYAQQGGYQMQQMPQQQPVPVGHGYGPPQQQSHPGWQQGPPSHPGMPPQSQPGYSQPGHSHPGYQQPGPPSQPGGQPWGGHPQGPPNTPPPPPGRPPQPPPRHR
ncbi:MAG: FHA domain-containing protein [Streptosporangiales bacterium]|nr:FHA domain-containing protein [Streptosporangiales bacterium]